MDASPPSIIEAILHGHPIAIELGQRWGQWPKIFLHVDGVKIGHVACVRYEEPKAYADGNVVHVKSSARLPGGFELKCRSEQEAIQVSELVAICLRNGFDELFGNPKR